MTLSEREVINGDLCFGNLKRKCTYNENFYGKTIKVFLFTRGKNEMKLIWKKKR